MNLVHHKPDTESIAPAKVTPPGHHSSLKRTRDRAAKQRALIRAALRLFATKGYDATTTREIAAEAGCAEGLIHRYFKGKAGLLPALVEYRISQEVLDLSHELPPAASFQEEFLQIVEWEVERAWETRDFFRVFIPRAIVDPSVVSVLNRSVLSSRGKAIAERLKRYPISATIPKDEFEVVVQSVGILSLVFGFMRPTLLGQDREQRSHQNRPAQLPPIDFHLTSLGET
jgi:TetR/AcrR family transcriptional regulator, regulator of cefoperazone and chloramphenicol sensitivity